MRTTVKEIVETMAGSVDISQAKIIVAGGRGVKDGDKYKEVIIPLAEKLGGEYGASRPVVDSGWTDMARQVGQSGKVVTPDLSLVELREFIGAEKAPAAEAPGCHLRCRAVAGAVQDRRRRDGAGARGS